MEQTSRGLIASARALKDRAKARFDDSLLGEVWARMLETEFVDRSVALAGKAFVSFFPLIIVVAAFLPAGMRSSVFTTLTLCQTVDQSQSPRGSGAPRPTR